ncbi:putative phenylalanine-4-hydroxylase 1, partial [Toxocara canis]
LYWFTVEFGVCVQNGERKAFGAGLLSSFGELQYALSDKPQIAPFEPAITSTTKYPITEYQPKYFLAHSFGDAKAKLTLEFIFIGPYFYFAISCSYSCSYGAGLQCDVSMLLRQSHAIRLPQ